MNPGSIHLSFQFSRPDDTREAFILPNEGTGIGIESSTGWFEDMQLDIENKSLTVLPENQGISILRIPSSLKEIKSDGGILIEQAPHIGVKFRYYKLIIDKPLPIKLEWK